MKKKKAQFNMNIQTTCNFQCEFFTQQIVWIEATLLFRQIKITYAIMQTEGYDMIYMKTSNDLTKYE